MSPQASSPPSSSMSSPERPQLLLRVLTHTANASALVFGTFLGVHLAAPVVGLAAVGAGALAGGAGDGGSMVDSASRVVVRPSPDFLTG